MSLEQQISELNATIKTLNETIKLLLQPSEDKALGLLIGAGKGAGSTLESGLRSVGQIAGGIGGAISVPIQERQQADLVTQYKQALQDKNPALAKQIYNQINQAGTMSRQAQ